MEMLAPDLATMTRTPLQDSHLDAMRAVGTVREIAAGVVIVRPGDPMDDFLYVEDGEIEELDPHSMERRVPSTLRPTQFKGEIGFLSANRYTMPMRACRPTRVLAVPRERMLALMSEIPELGDIVITVFAARRRRQIEAGDSSLVLIGAEVDRGVRRVAAFADRNRIPYRSLALGCPEAEAEAQTCALLPRTPAVVFDNQPIAEPTPQTVARLLGLDIAAETGHLHDVLIVGGGPAGVAAGVYAGAEGLSALVIDDLAIGGQAGTSSRIENYMGFPTGISGADLCWRGEVQALKFGTRFAVPRRATGLARHDDGSFCVSLDTGGEVCARALVVATGVRYRRLDLAGTDRFEGAGLYYAATDLEARWCRNSEVVVIGGGNSAGQAAMFLSRSAAHVHVVVRGASLARSMSDYLLARLRKDPAITIHHETAITALHGDNHLAAATLSGPGGDMRLATRAVFVMIGAAPNTDWLSGLVALDDRGFVRTGAATGADSPYATSAPGIFAVGDIRSGSVQAGGKLGRRGLGGDLCRLGAPQRLRRRFTPAVAASISPSHETGPADHRSN